MDAELAYYERVNEAEEIVRAIAAAPSLTYCHDMGVCIFCSAKYEWSDEAETSIAAHADDCEYGRAVAWVKAHPA